MIFEYSILEEETHKAYNQIMGTIVGVPSILQLERITMMAGVNLFARIGINPADLPPDEFGKIIVLIRKAMPVKVNNGTPT
jgi:hypothetical protein